MAPRATIRGMVLLLSSASWLALAAGTAAAAFTSNNIGCSGKAVIRYEGGAGVMVDANDARITIREEPRSAEWKGATGVPVHNHHGEVFLDLGLADVPLGDWGSENKKDETKASGTKGLSAFWAAPPGIYAVAGSHTGDEGTCTGRVEVVYEGNPAWKIGGGMATAFFAVLLGVSWTAVKTPVAR